MYSGRGKTLVDPVTLADVLAVPGSDGATWLMENESCAMVSVLFSRDSVNAFIPSGVNPTSLKRKCPFSASVARAEADPAVGLSAIDMPGAGGCPVFAWSTRPAT